MIVRRAEAGFTLVELLAVLLVGSLLLVTLGWMTATFGRQARLSDDDAARIEESVTGEAMLRHLVEAASPEALGFTGTPDRATMTVPAPQALGERGQVRLTLAFEPRAGALTARFAPLGGDALPAFARAPTVLLGRLTGARFRYTGEQGGLRRTGEDWPPAAKRPSLVELTLTPVDGERYTIVMMPRIQADGRCRFDPVSLSCGA